MIRGVLAVCLALWPGPGGADCRQALALGLDVSGSVDRREYALQIEGVATALRDPVVRAAFLTMPEAPVRLMVFEWSGLEDQRVILPWTRVTGPADLDRAARILRGTPPPAARDRSTALGQAILFGARALRAQPCWRRVLDISGDGPGNLGAHPGALPEAALSGLTVNGLVIGPTSRANTTKDLTNVPTLQSYYERFVIRGPGAFVEPARDYDDVARAMRRKLVRELRLPGLALHAHHPARADQ